MSKKLEKPFVYKREYDLTGYDVDILQKYQLEQAIYIYVGSSCAYNIKARSSKWRHHINIGQYQFLDSVNYMLKQKIILLSNNDSALRMVKNGSQVSLKIKNKYIEKHKNKPIMRYHINCQFNTDGSVKSITQEFEPILELSNKKNTLSRPSRVFSK